MTGSTQPPSRERGKTSRRMRWVAILALAVVGLIVYRQLAPAWSERTAVVYALYIGRAAYPLIVLAAAVVFGVSVVAAIRLRARGHSWQPTLRWAVLSGAVLAMVLPIELVAEQVLRWSHRLPELPTRFGAQETTANTGSRSRSIVVVG